MIPSHLKTAIDHYIPGQEGWTSPERCCEMAELIIETRPSLVVEIGVFAGRTLIAQAMALRENNHGVIYGIDAWNFEAAVEGESAANKEYWKKLDINIFHQQTMQSIWDHRLDPWCVVVRSRSEHCVHVFKGIDVLNIDGCHSEESSARDVRNYLPRVNRGGFIWMDDTDWAVDGKPSTVTAQQLLEAECKVVKSPPDGHYKLYQKL